MSVKVRKKYKDGKDWWVFVNHRGRRMSRKVGTKTAANRARIEIEAALAAGTFSFDKRQEQKDHTLKRYAELWLVEFDKKDKKGLESIFRNHIAGCPFIDSPVDTITKGEIRRFLNSKRKKLSASTVIHIKSFLSRSFALALEDEIISVNPAVGITVHIGEKFEAKPYNQEEVEALLSAAADGWPEHYPLVLFLARTGCRLGEALGLQWDCVHLGKKRFVDIRRTYRLGTLQQTTKNNKRREVDLTQQLCKELAAIRLASQSTCGYVFGSMDKPIDSDNFRRRVWPKIIKAAGLRKTRIHDLRHSYATNLISQTQNVYYTSNQLGHSKISTTLEIYNKYKREGGETRVVDALDPGCTLSAPGKKKEIAG